jgi:hypothetical protein
MIKLNSAVNAVEKEVRVAKAKETVFAKYQRITLEKLDKSIEEAEGRWGENATPYSDAKPSLNWKVVKKSDNPQHEHVAVWLKVGIEKVEIDEGKKELRFNNPQQAIECLNEMREMIAQMSMNDEVGRSFHEVAIKQAKPKTAPKASGAKDWKYNPTSDMYEIVYDSLKAV